MIKNDAHLGRATSRLQELHHEIESVQGAYTGLELEIMARPLLSFAADIKREIEEYLEIRELGLEKAVPGPLRQPVTLGNIASLLSKLRIAGGLTQSQLASRLGWQQSNLSRFESETYASQTIGKVVEYASALNVWLHVAPSMTESPPWTGTMIRDEGAFEATYRFLREVMPTGAVSTFFDLADFDPATKQDPVELKTDENAVEPKTSLEPVRVAEEKLVPVSA